MTLLANTWLIVFLVDGGISVLDLLLGEAALGGLHAGVAWLAIGISMPILLLLSISPRLPKRIFLPQVLFLHLVPVAILPLYLYAPATRVHLGAALFQLGLAGMGFAQVRARTGGSWLLSRGALEGPSFSWRTVLLFNGAALVVVLPALTLYLAWTVALTLDHFTDGFLRLAPSGLYTEQRVYVRGPTTVRLIGMMHIGDASFFDEVLAALPPEGSVILAEGARDADHLLPQGLAYDRLARLLGLDDQNSALGVFAGRNVVNADVDVNQFSQPTLGLLNTVSLALTSSDPVAALLRIDQYAGSVGEADLQAVLDDVLHLRSRNLLREIETYSREYPELVVPWGAAHMPELESGLRERGFALAERQELRIIGF